MKRLPLITIGVLLMAGTLASPARSEIPDVVRPLKGTLAELREVSTSAARSIGERLDHGHDWLYRRAQQWLASLDSEFAELEGTPIIVPLSPLRVGFLVDVVHRPGGFRIGAIPDIEATLRLPNLEHRLKLFVTSADLPEPPDDPTLERQPIRAGLRLNPLAHVDVEFGARFKVWPSAFASVKWSPDFSMGPLRGYGFVKPYVESGVGIGLAAGIAAEFWDGRWFVRSASYANWVHNTSLTNWEQSFVGGYARAIIQERRYDRLASGHDLACGTALRLSVSGDRLTGTSLYQGGIMIKRPIHGGWLFAYVEPEITWDRSYRWHPDAGVRIGFDALFWGLSAPVTDAAVYCQ